MAPRRTTPNASTNRAGNGATLTHEERLEVIRRPFPQVRILGRSYLWAGTLIERDPFGRNGQTRKRGRGRYDEVAELANEGLTVTLDELVALSEV